MIKDFFITVLIVMSSISLVDARHIYRVIYDEAQKKIQHHRNVKKEILDYKKLLSMLKDKARIEAIAQDDLNMVPVSSQNTVMLKIE